MDQNVCSLYYCAYFRRLKHGSRTKKTEQQRVLIIASVTGESTVTPSRGHRWSQDLAEKVLKMWKTDFILMFYCGHVKRSQNLRIFLFCFCTLPSLWFRTDANGWLLRCSLLFNIQTSRTFTEQHFTKRRRKKGNPIW